MCAAGYVNCLMFQFVIPCLSFLLKKDFENNSGYAWVSLSLAKTELNASWVA